MEVLLTRLLVIMRIEEKLSNFSTATGDVLWEAWSHIMEIAPRNRLCPPITDKHAEEGVKAIFREQETYAKINKQKSGKQAKESNHSNSETEESVDIKYFAYQLLF